MTKKIFLLFNIIFFFFLTACNNNNQVSPSKYPNNMIELKNNWEAKSDNYGSSISDIPLFEDSSIAKVEFTLINKTKEDEYPYIELICKLGDNLVNIDTLVLTYKCTTPLIVKLSQSDFGGNGNATYSHFQYILESANDFITVQFLISDFKQPEWTPEKSKLIKYNPTNVDAVYFTPQIDEITGGKATLEIKEFYLK